MSSRTRVTRASRGLTLIAAVVLASTACGSGSTTKTSAADGVVATSADDFDPENFDATSIDVDNKYMPLTPGTQLTYEGQDVIDGEATPHRVVGTVTDLVKTIDGVDVVVFYENDYVRDNLEESELTFFAQDTTGTVWHLGQYSELYEDGKELIGGRAWMVGYVEGARAGIFMSPDPKEGSPSYSEGFAPPPYYWTDMAQVSKTGETTKVPAGDYDNVLVTKEWTQQAPDEIQLKYYAPGLGVVRVGFAGEDTEQETLELVAVKHLSPKELAHEREEALKLEAHANVYGKTTAARRRDAGS